ncbi:MAG: sugar transferase, partial [Candidatus Omnitrophota bacterium]
MKKLGKKVRVVIPALIALVFIFVFMRTVYAQPPSGTHNVPEPNSAILLYVGSLGWIVRFVRKRFLRFKKIFDMVAAALGLVVLSPVIALSAVYIKIVSPGPVFFRQERVGKQGRPFMMYK